ncbi:glycosyltransferase [Lactobacillus amylovorus]|uniref:glycosyltransferase n=1 Tax=Lactobacillus amylovorus TaxID=1604 RepID=UPI001F57A794|nr:glycosyltransferase [Lactobacillus amylovorus]UNL46186.1 glycosyltransferase [Lactobacillus amylovorus]
MKNKKNKIVLAATSGKMFSGASKALLELAQNFKKRNIQVIVLLPEEGDLKIKLDQLNISSFVFREYNSWYTWEKNNKINIFKYVIKRVLNYLTILKIEKFLKKEKPDIVHVNALTAYTVGAAAINSHIPVVWHIREFMEEDLGVKFTNKKFSLKLLNQATAYIAISKSVKKKWQPFFSKDINVVYDGLPLENYLVKKKNIKKTNINVILYGRIVPGKGQLFFLQGMNYLLKKYPQVHVSLAGFIEDKNYFSKCEQFIRKNNLSSKIDYVGEVSNIKELLENQNIVCVCSVKEGFGRVIIESMLAKCIVVSADSGAASELIEDGKNGYLYKANSKEEFEKKVEKAILEKDNLDLDDIQKDAEKFSTNNNANKILRIYKNIV